MTLIEDGNFSRWLRMALFVVGAGNLRRQLGDRLVTSMGTDGRLRVGFRNNGFERFLQPCAMLGIKPFDNSYGNARKSYSAGFNEENMQ
ncbi:hypothetical protein H3V53_11920 [Paraburkholderia bengalensis]|uniref:Uncharacterized protein n=1 Tax=Paraburkholderia bengalensis TaxID=2747562 RepID=A0ABU8IQW1_9BURK